LKPDYTSFVHAPGLIPYVLSNPGQEYAIYLQSVTDSSVIQANIPSGNYIVKLMNTVNGEVLKEETIEVGNDIVQIDFLIPDGELAISIRRI